MISDKVKQELLYKAQIIREWVTANCIGANKNLRKSALLNLHVQIWSEMQANNYEHKNRTQVIRILQEYIGKLNAVKHDCFLCELFLKRSNGWYRSATRENCQGQGCYLAGINSIDERYSCEELDEPYDIWSDYFSARTEITKPMYEQAIMDIMTLKGLL